MTELDAHRWLIWVLVGAAPVVFGVLQFVTAPYGRHGRHGWGPTLPVRAGWLLMESPSALLFPLVFTRGAHSAELVPALLLGLWLVHYLHRAFIFPIRMRTGDRTMPWLIVAFGFAFNTANAYVNARWISHFGQYGLGWLLEPRFVVGAALFATGLAVNLHADTVLLKLRGPEETGYKVPQGGLFRWVSSPNYLGELLEWTGWALATWSLAGLAFALFTAANLVPRAMNHHRWYRETFPDYPRERRALLPLLF